MGWSKMVWSKPFFDLRVRFQLEGALKDKGAPGQAHSARDACKEYTRVRNLMDLGRIWWTYVFLPLIRRPRNLTELTDDLGPPVPLEDG
jgi:hypothetical protein